MALTVKQERFCQLVALKQMTQTAAYSEVYDITGKTPEGIAKLASAVANRPGMQERISVLRERGTVEAVRKAGRTLADCVQGVEELIEDAKNLGQISAGIAGAKLRAQLLGHLVEKKEVRQGPLDDADLTKLQATLQHVDEQLTKLSQARDLVGGSAPVPVEFMPLRRAIG